MSNTNDIEKTITDLEKNDTDKKTEKKERKTKTTDKKTSTKLSKEDIAEKIYLIFNFPYFLLRKHNKYIKEDFLTEAEAIQRLSTKYEIIKNIFVFFDPILILISLLEKVVKNKE